MTKWRKYLPLGGVIALLEPLIIRQLIAFGPVLAIGRPDEFEPPLGAMRFYVRHDIWEPTVERIARDCQLIVWTSGFTKGLQWELKHLLHSVEPSKLVIWLHMQLIDGPEGERQAQWDRFLELYGDSFPKPLPRDLDEMYFIAFDKDWNPIAVRGRGNWATRLRLVAPCEIRPTLDARLGKPPLSFRALLARLK